MDFTRVIEHDPETVTDQPQEAAVIVPVIDPDGASKILFTKRAEHLSDHPGQMSFPGGGRESADDSLVETAKREANEEVGLSAEEIDMVGRLDDIRTISHYSVRPFVAEVPDRRYEPMDEEVAEVAILSVSALTDLDNYESERRDHPHEGSVRLHYFHVNGYTVWGATANMFVQFLEFTTEWETPPEVDRAVDADAEFPV